MDIQDDKDFAALPEVAKLYQACKERDLTIAEREYLKGARDVWQAAKAQAIPEGFILVKQVHPDSIVHNQGLGLFKECQVIYGWNGKSKEFKDALNKGFYYGVKLGARSVLETAIQSPIGLNGHEGKK